MDISHRYYRHVLFFRLTVYSMSFKSGLVQMWKYLLPVSKMCSDKNTASDRNTTPPLKYKKTRARKISLKWPVGRTWLQNMVEKV